MFQSRMDIKEIGIEVIAVVAARLDPDDAVGVAHILPTCLKLHSLVGMSSLTLEYPS